MKLSYVIAFAAVVVASTTVPASAATGHKFHDSIEYYADPCKDGDVVGVLLDMEYGRLSFYVNGRNLGVAHSGIQAKKLCPVFSMTFIGQNIKLLPTASPPMP
ncbi:hypothetical protein ON010_g9158 [Phytophthora cinnamomi]|nr:hypothetical protein ON010_g9158 [Phytophthora cinnamomi]